MPRIFTFTLTIFFILIGLKNATAFSFREFNEREPVPNATVFRLDDSAPISFSRLKGKAFIAIFWGADLPEKIERSVQTLRTIEQSAAFFKDRDITLLSVNIQEDGPEAINRVVGGAKSRIPVYIDKNGLAYGALGVYVIPSLLLVDKHGIVTAGFGYSHDAVDRLKGAVEIMLGEKTEEQVATDLRPVMEEKSEEEKAAGLHMSYGFVMLKRGHPEEAAREFEKALERQPDLARAHIELGCILLDIGEPDRARQSIDKGLAIDPDNIPGLICRAKQLLDDDMIDEAVMEFKQMAEDHPDSAKLRYHLGRAYDTKKETALAMAGYREAYLLLLAKTNH